MTFILEIMCILDMLHNPEFEIDSFIFSNALKSLEYKTNEIWFIEYESNEKYSVH